MSAASYLALVLTGLYCYFQVKHNTYIYAPSSFLVLLTNAALGLWLELGNPFSVHSLDKIHNYASIIQELLLLPCVVSAVLTKYDYLREMVFCNVLISLIPLISYTMDRREVSDDLLEGIIMMNCTVLGLVSFIQVNVLGLTASVTYAFNHFHVKNIQETTFGLNESDLYNYVMCIFALCSVHAMI